MKNKWKEFAINEMLSIYNGDAVELYDAMMDPPEGDLDDVFAKYDVLEWEPFENYGHDYMVGQIHSPARHAAEAEGNRLEALGVAIERGDPQEIADLWLQIKEELK